LNALLTFSSIKSSSSEEETTPTNGTQQSRVLRQIPGGGFIPSLPRSGGFGGTGNFTSVDLRLDYPLSQKLGLFSQIQLLNNSGGGVPDSKRRDLGLGLRYRISDRIDFETTLARVSNAGDASNAYRANTIESRLSFNF
jgi:hypothetical protein